MPNRENSSQQQPGMTAILAGLALLASGCSSTTFESTWKAPDAAPLHLAGQKVAAICMTGNAATRRRAEDALAREISARGAEGVPAYTVLSDEETVSEGAARQKLESLGFTGAVAMRVVGRDAQIRYEPSVWAGPNYRHFWGGGYWHWGWGSVWDPGMVAVDTVVRVETLVYSLRRDELLWAGVSSTVDPTHLETFISDLAASVSKEMAREGLLTAS